mmetsp:Transcript_70697/g.199614  ORF Transcript_70697/g.199614 Transcript_70697/m.199614 type:complete len:613 (-) Transcript_70697:150-1988(-)
MASTKTTLCLSLPKPSFMLMLLMATHPVLGGKARFLDPSTAVKTSDADSILAEDIALAAGTPGSRVVELEAALRETYEALPKNSNSRLGHQAVLYALHRFFVQRHGWHISGLAPGGDVWRTMVPSAKDVSLDEWVPSYLLNRVEERLGNHGITLRELAALAAMLEDIVRKDAVTQMKLVYDLYDYPTSGTIDRKQADLVLDTYFMVYLLARKFASDSTADALAKRRRFHQTYHNLTEAEVWFHSLELRHMGADAREVDFAATSGIAKDVGEEFSKFNDQECRDLKQSLRALQGRTVKGGRVRLPDFYNASRYSHWKFTERPEYLRAIGAFDDSDPKQQYVIVPNYIQSRSNCLQASPLYAVCCRNECEDLMQHLEAKIAAPSATADRIAALVAALPSHTVAAPRQLPETLLRRLNQIAATAKGNAVNLHGRLFAQWMHHAYPAECPYPHEAGTTSEQTPSQWKEATGEASHTASEEELRQHVEGDTCPATGEPCDAPEDGRAVELPWSEAEELLVRPEEPGGQWPSGLQLLALALAAAFGVVAWRPPAVVLVHSLRPAVAGCSALGLAFGLDLLDTLTFVIMVFGGLGVLAVRRWLPELYCLPETKSAKSCV